MTRMGGFSLALALLLGMATGPAAQAAVQPVTVEYYYKIKWGSADEFKRLYKRNHQPILDEMKRQGFITQLTMDEPFTHMAGDQRWDLRVTITFNDPRNALPGGPYDAAAEKATKRLFPDEAKFGAEEDRRFSLLEEHWDVIVSETQP